jgi:hypothetical protein
MTDHSTPDLNSIRCYRARWSDPDVPPGEPTWLYYEVDTAAVVVLRTVDVFADGRIKRDSIALEERKGDRCSSLVDCSFIETMRSIPLDLIADIEFEKLWQRGTDTPFWFPDGFRKTARL